VEAFVVVPAATARNLTSSARGVLFVGIAVALLAGVLGLVVSSLSFVPTGGAVVLVGSVLFAASVLLRKR
jgi:zinc transport system permease protein